MCIISLHLYILLYFFPILSLLLWDWHTQLGSEVTCNSFWWINEWVHEYLNEYFWGPDLAQFLAHDQYSVHVSFPLVPWSRASGLFYPKPPQEDHQGDFQRQNSLRDSESYQTEIKTAIQFFIWLCITAPLFFWGMRIRQPDSHLMLSPLPRSSHFRIIRLDKVRAQSRRCCLALMWDWEYPEQQYWGEVGREGWAGESIKS